MPWSMDDARSWRVGCVVLERSSVSVPCGMTLFTTDRTNKTELAGLTHLIDIVEGSPAEAQGLLTGDFLLSVRGIRVRDLSNAELAGLLRQAAPVPVVVARAPVAGYDVGLVPDVVPVSLKDLLATSTNTIILNTARQIPSGSSDAGDESSISHRTYSDAVDNSDSSLLRVGVTTIVSAGNAAIGGTAAVQASSSSSSSTLAVGDVVLAVGDTILTSDSTFIDHVQFISEQHSVRRVAGEGSPGGAEAGGASAGVGGDGNGVFPVLIARQPSPTIPVPRTLLLKHAATASNSSKRGAGAGAGAARGVGGAGGVGAAGPVGFSVAIMKDGSAATEDDAGGEFKVEVRRVVAGSVAADAGVMVGDTVAAINSFTLDSLGSNEDAHFAREKLRAELSFASQPQVDSSSSSSSSGDGGGKGSAGHVTTMTVMRPHENFAAAARNQEPAHGQAYEQAHGHTYGHGGSLDDGVKKQKHADSITKAEWYMGMALITAKRSKDPKTQVGCAIVDEMGVVVSVGYNGMPIACSDDELPWAKTAESDLDTKFPYVVHAEANSVLNAGESEIENCTMYTTLFPCQQCTKVLIQAKIGHVVYLSDKSHHKEGPTAARKMLDMSGVTYEQFVPRANKMQVTVDLTSTWLCPPA